MKTPKNKKRKNIMIHHDVKDKFVHVDVYEYKFTKTADLDKLIKDLTESRNWIRFITAKKTTKKVA